MTMEAASHGALHRSRIAVMRQHEQVTPLELFFDLVFVLAITQCTQLMSSASNWGGIARGLLVLGILWWVWVGYAWLTSVIDPEEGAVRGVMFAAMAALLTVALCVPESFGDRALAFALAYGFVRLAHIGLFVIASREKPEFRKSVVWLAASTAAAVAILVAGAVVGQPAQGWIWLAALFLDLAVPYFFGAEGWRLAPAHFAERHGLIVIIALGESIVAIGIGVGHHVTFHQGIAAIAGVAIAAAMWWLYFDVVALVAQRRLGQAHRGRHQNEIARDSYSYLHFPMIAGIVLFAFGMKAALAHVGASLALEPVVGLLGGLSLYLLGHVAFRWRNLRTINRQRTALAVVLVALLPLAGEVSALAAILGTATLAWALIAYELIAFAETREQIRHADYARTPALRDSQ